MENTAYMDTITAGRALAEFAEDGQAALEGMNMLSLETQAGVQEEDALTWARENFAQFLKLLRGLKSADQDLLICYYALGTSQAALAPLFRATQTICSFRLRAAMKALCVFGRGKPDAARLHAVLGKAGLEGDLGVPLSQLVAEYAECRSFHKVAAAHGIHRPLLRKAIRRATGQLAESQDAEEQCIGAYMHTLVDGASPRGTGLSKRKRMASADIFRSDPDALGKFRVRVDSEEFAPWFVSKASH